MRYFEGNITVSAQKGNICSFHNKIKANRACSSIRYNGSILTTDEITLNGWSMQVTKY